MKPFTPDSAETLAEALIARANARLAQTTPYTMPFGATERDAPNIHALIQAVAEEILLTRRAVDAFGNAVLGLDARVARLEGGHPPKLELRP